MISRSRRTIIARVGVCTRPSETGERGEPMRVVAARVAFMPISQSDSERERAASSSGRSSESSRRCSNASRMADFVIEENQARRTGFSTLAVCRMSLKMSSPSRPASQALTRPSMSLRRIAACRLLSCFPAFASRGS